MAEGGCPPEDIIDDERRPLLSDAEEAANYGCDLSRQSSQAEADLSSVIIIDDGDGKSSKGCLSQESLTTKIEHLQTVYVETSATKRVDTILEKYKHVTICGAPGEGKTCLALMLAKKYLQKNYQVHLVDNIENFDINLIIHRRCPTLFIFDDVFGSITFPSNLDERHRIFKALSDALDQLQDSAQQKLCKKNKKECAKSNKQPPKILIVFTTRTYNLNEGRVRFFDHKNGLFKQESLVDLTEVSFSVAEKEQILTSYRKKRPQCDMSNEDIRKISKLRKSVLGFPLTCRLFFTIPKYQRQTLVFFQQPLIYLRGELNNIVVSEKSSRSAAIIMLVLCEGKLNLEKFHQDDGQMDALFRVVNTIVPNVNKQDIRSELLKYEKTYCVLENNIASFSHPSVYDAAAFAFGLRDPLLLVKHCSLRFLYERVRHCKLGNQLHESDDDVNLIQIDSSCYDQVVKRLSEGIKAGCFRWTLKHPLLSHKRIGELLLCELGRSLRSLVSMRDSASGESYLHWAALSTCEPLFKRSLRCTFKTICCGVSLKNNALESLKDAAIACVNHGHLDRLQEIICVMRNAKQSINFTTLDMKNMLMLAATRGDTTVFGFLLEEGVDLHHRDNTGNTCLHHALQSGNSEIARKILEIDPELVNKEDACECTPVMIAAMFGHDKAIKFLVESEHPVSLTKPDARGNNLLHLACLGGHLLVVQYLLSLKCLDINERGDCGRTAVMIAARRGHHHIHGVLVNNDADLSLVDNHETDCLMHACVGGSQSIVEDLVSRQEFDVNRREKFIKRTAIMTAALKGNFEIYEVLVNCGSNIKLKDGKDDDLFTLACKGGNCKIIEDLLQKGFGVDNGSDSSTSPALMAAASHGHDEVFKLLTQKAKLSIKADERGNCLHAAIQGGSAMIVKHMLINGNMQMDKPSLLQEAIQRGHLEVYNYLLSQGARPEELENCVSLVCGSCNPLILKHLLSFGTFNIDKAFGTKQRTAVMISAWKGCYETFALLVNAKANIKLKDKSKNDCLMLACLGGNLAIVTYLVSLNVFPLNGRNGSKQTPVMLAAKAGFYDIYHYLFSKGASIYLTDEVNYDCLMLASQGGHHRIVAHLLTQKRVQINRKDTISGRTALMMAVFAGHFHVYKLLMSKGANHLLMDKKKMDCLKLACEGPNKKILKHMLSLKRLNFNRRDDVTGNTPLMAAAQQGNFPLYTLLVQEGACSPNGGSGCFTSIFKFRSSSQESVETECLFLACNAGSVEIVSDLLNRHVIDINKKETLSDHSPVMIAAREGNFELYNLLISAGADPAIETDNVDCLMLACQSGSVPIVEHLLSLGKFDVKKVCIVTEKTPLEAAHQHPAVCELLTKHTALSSSL